MQAARVLPLLRGKAHGAKRGPPDRLRHPGGADASMGAVVSDPLRLLLAAHPELLSPLVQIIHRVIATLLIKQSGLKRGQAHSGASRSSSASVLRLT